MASGGSRLSSDPRAALEAAEKFGGAAGAVGNGPGIAGQIRHAGPDSPVIAALTPATGGAEMPVRC